MNRRESKILVLGSSGLVGSAILRLLREENYAVVCAPSRRQLDLCSKSDVYHFFHTYEPDYVFLAAAEVGGIEANNARPVDFLRHNLEIAVNAISATAELTKAKLLFLGSSCIYPKHAEQPIREDALLSGPLEPTNQWYAIAKIAGLKLIQAYRRQHGKPFISCMPTNLYGPGDNYDPTSSHVIPALMHRFHHAKSATGPVKVWGQRETRREFLFVDDLARALLLLMRTYDGDEWINVGYGADVTMGWAATQVAEVVGLDPERLEFDPTMPVGMLRKLLESSKIREMGWQPYVNLREGLIHTYTSYLQTPHAACEHLP